MRTLLIALFTLFVSQVFAQTDSEEAIILNQELQFLEEAAALRPTNLPGSEMAERSQAPRERNSSLEDTYFGEESEDSVSTRLASPKKRGF